MGMYHWPAQSWSVYSPATCHHGLLASRGKVSCSLLIHKLNQYGIKGENRAHCVVIEGEESDIIIVESGVLQGSVLGQWDYLQMSPHYVTRKEENPNKLATCEDKWMMLFHPDKCVVLPVT